jgi:hypothetical protein
MSRISRVYYTPRHTKTVLYQDSIFSLYTETRQKTKEAVYGQMNTKKVKKDKKDKNTTNTLYRGRTFYKRKKKKKHGKHDQHKSEKTQKSKKHFMYRDKAFRATFFFLDFVTRKRH